VENRKIETLLSVFISYDLKLFWLDLSCPKVISLDKFMLE